MFLSRQLAEFVEKTGFEDIPASVIENQKKSVMDAISITFGASTMGDGCQQMVKLAEELAAEGRPEATVIGFGKKLPASWAAFANGSMAHSLDYGDTHSVSTVHSNSSSFPAALAVAEQMGNVSGRDFLTALIVGSEVAIRIANAADINTVDRGFYVPTIYSSFGAVAAVGKLMGLTAEQLVAAFSFNLCQTTCSSELMKNKKTVVRSVREAFAARNAIVSCKMAKENLIGFEQPLEGELGLYHMLLEDRYTAERALEGLGSVWEAEKLTYKVWPCCFGTHSPITATMQLMQENDLNADDVDSVLVEVGAQNIGLLEPIEQRRNPDTAITAKFSIPFAVACTIVHGTVRLQSFSPEGIRDPAVLAMANKVAYNYRKDWQRGKETWANVTLYTKKGEFTRFVTSPYGTPENPMTDEAFAEKFFSCASGAFCPKSGQELENIRKTIQALDTVNDVRKFAALL